MSTTSIPLVGAARPGLLGKLWRGNVGPVLVVVAAIMVVWYVAAVAMNWQGVSERFARMGQDASAGAVFWQTMAEDRPMLPVPHQILVELHKTVLDVAPTSRRSLVYHATETISATLVGFLMGSALGVLLAVGIVHLRTLQKSLMPWVISSQTVPILAIAPIIVVVLGSIGLRGLIPKAIISAYLCFFPVTIGMVKGLEAPDRMQRDLMRTYSASTAEIFWKLRLPASLPYLFASLKVAIAISLVGAIVAELPTGAQAGLGARLLAGSYYGQTIQIWSALVVAAACAALLVVAVGLLEKAVMKAMGGRP
ncbi:ABC transporter permease [Salinarimonas ramus]|uniref:ABC transporter permease n=1 Tax=Salinarimonas ramus TaxID=690164 RepID=A0A917Q4W6_9HYPH|nr:ABC transporter permease [Salinarimonas ramus]